MIFPWHAKTLWSPGAQKQHKSSLRGRAHEPKNISLGRSCRVPWQVSRPNDSRTARSAGQFSTVRCSISFGGSAICKNVARALPFNPFESSTSVGALAAAKGGVQRSTSFGEFVTAQPCVHHAINLEWFIPGKNDLGRIFCNHHFDVIKRRPQHHYHYRKQQNMCEGQTEDQMQWKRDQIRSYHIKQWIYSDTPTRSIERSIKSTWIHQSEQIRSYQKKHKFTSDTPIRSDQIRLSTNAPRIHRSDQRISVQIMSSTHSPRVSSHTDWSDQVR